MKKYSIAANHILLVISNSIAQSSRRRLLLRSEYYKTPKVFFNIINNRSKMYYFEHRKLFFIPKRSLYALIGANAKHHLFHNPCKIINKMKNILSQIPFFLYHAQLHIRKHTHVFTGTTILILKMPVQKHHHKLLYNARSYSIEKSHAISASCISLSCTR